MLVVKPDIINLGRVKFGTKNRFQYTITNNYPVTVEIDQIVAGCTSCTKAVATSTTLLPNGKTTIDVVFTPGYLGLQTKTITIICFVAGALLPQIKVKFKALVHE